MDDDDEVSGGPALSAAFTDDSIALVDAMASSPQRRDYVVNLIGVHRTRLLDPVVAAVALVNADGSGGEHLQALEARATTLSLDEFFVNVRKYRSVAEIDRIVAQGEAYFNSVVTRLAGAIRRKERLLAANMAAPAAGAQAPGGYQQQPKPVVARLVYCTVKQLTVPRCPHSARS